MFAAHTRSVRASAGSKDMNRHSKLATPATSTPLAPIPAQMLSFFTKGSKKRHSHREAAATPQGAPAVELADGPTATSISPPPAPFPVSTQPQQAAPPPPPVASGKVFKLALAAVCLPHPDKVHYGGEDAYFISDYGGGALGVADGVGGWQESGVNPADYSRGLMEHARAYLEGTDMFAESAANRSGVLIDPRGALDAAHSSTKVPGSATACVMQLDQENRTLVAANLGDSGFIVLRDGKELIKSKPLQHYFDCPLQFGAFPEYVEATDTADMADLYSIALRPGDVIIAGSDGLWDNCYISEIIELAPKSPLDVERAASDLAAAARKHASDQDFPSPYTREALAQGLDLPWWDKLMGMTFKSGRLQLKQLTGGKMDDITVLTAYVDQVDPPAPPPAAVEASTVPPSSTAQTQEASADNN